MHNCKQAHRQMTLSDLDHTHVLHLSGIYELPFGAGKPWLSQAHGITRAVAAGWQLQTTWQFFTGPPLGFGDALLVAPMSDITSGPQTIAQWFNIAAFDRKSADALSWNVQSLSSRLSGVRGPGVNMWNLSTLKNFQLNERFRLQFRAEMLNAFNHTCLSNPNTNPTNAAFGSITAASSQPRFIHLALKLTF